MKISNSKPFNMIISGVGGQGVFTLTKVIWELCKREGYHYQGSTFKGGAQRLGSIHTELRIFFNSAQDYAQYSSQIPLAELDLMIGLEPWETLRYYEYFGERTRIFVNTSPVPLFLERYQTFKIKDPVAKLKELGFVVAKDYTELAQRKFHTKKMLNYVIGLDAFTESIFSFNKETFVNIFKNQVKLDKEVLVSLQE